MPRVREVCMEQNRPNGMQVCFGKAPLPNQDPQLGICHMTGACA
jgi:hypothetical protein